MTSVSVAVMAHPKRAAMVDDLLGRLDRRVEVVWDEVNDRHDTGIRAIQAADMSATHHLVIQDDVVPCRDLIAGVEQALEHVPEGRPASFYIGRVMPFRRKVDEAVRAARGCSWVTMDGVYWGPAIAIPTSTIPEISEYWPKSKWTNYDRRLSKWFEFHGRECWYSWPSLVEHRGDESLVWDGKAKRTAHRFTGIHGSALDLDWSGRVAVMHDTSELDRRRQRRAMAGAR